MIGVAVYLAASLAWLWIVEAQRPDRWDLIGSGDIPFGPRAA